MGSLTRCKVENRSIVETKLLRPPATLGRKEYRGTLQLPATFHFQIFNTNVVMFERTSCAPKTL